MSKELGVKIPDELIDSIAGLDGMIAVRSAKLPALPSSGGGALGLDSTKPVIRPNNPKFGSGPCSKRPGYDVAELPTGILGRSHRSSEGLALLNELTNESKRILSVPDEYHVGVMPGSDTGAFEAAMWNLLGSRPVDIVHFESFGTGWYKDAVQQLKLDVRNFGVDAYGEFPDVSGVSPAHDLVFTYNGTTSGVRVPDGAPFIADNREGILPNNDRKEAAILNHGNRRDHSRTCMILLPLYVNILIEILS